ncbi:hypothetical protein BC828DRAFT_376412 [Blastocladiella britannica]|nr:hypothetical protein BC828DRAFT_376412 [Blastocladiella britannica]
MTSLLDGEIELDAKDIAGLRKQYEAEQPNPTAESEFHYGWGLVHSRVRRDNELGVVLLAKVAQSTPTLRVEANYFSALGYFKLGDLAKAREFTEKVLKAHPAHPQARAVMAAIDEQVQKDGLVGMAIVGGAVAALGLVVGALARSRK